MVLENSDIRDAVVEYLERRGMTVIPEQVNMSVSNVIPPREGFRFSFEVFDVQLPPKEGPFR